MRLPLNNSVQYTLCFSDDQTPIDQVYEDINHMIRKLRNMKNKG